MKCSRWICFSLPQFSGETSPGGGGAGLVGLSHFHNDNMARYPEISIHAVNVNVGICFSSISVALTYGKCDNLICTYLCLNVVVE